MNTKRLVQIGGVINLLFAAFHLSFWKLFNWQQSLAVLSSDARAVMQVLNIHTAYIVAVCASLACVVSREMSASKLGRMVGMSIAGFWILRAVNEAVFWDVSSVRSWVLIVVCFVIAGLYIIPLARKGAIQD